MSASPLFLATNPQVIRIYFICLCSSLFVLPEGTQTVAVTNTCNCQTMPANIQCTAACVSAQ